MLNLFFPALLFTAVSVNVVNFLHCMLFSLETLPCNLDKI